MRILIVTTCWWPSLARFADLLRRQSCQVSVLAPPGHAMEAINGITVIRHQGFRPIAALRQAVQSCAPDILIPGDDRAVAHMHALHARGNPAERGLVERSLGDPRSYSVVRSRLAFAACARGLGLAVPEDRRLATRRDVADWTAAHPAPYVLKRDGAWSGQGVHVVRQAQEAEAAWRDLAQGLSLAKALKRLVVNRDAFWLGDRRHAGGAVVSAQSYIEGHPGNIAFFAVRGDLRSALCVETEASWGETGPSTIVRVVDRPDIRNAAATLCRALGLSGFYGIDFMIDSATGQARLIEMNPRVTALCNIRWDAARDLIGAALRAWGADPAPCDRFAETVATAQNTELIAHFPLSWHWNSLDPRLATCFQDIPIDQPALVTAMLAPSRPDRSPLARLYAWARRSLRDEVRLAGPEWAANGRKPAVLF
jgi:hypothetical protein